MRKTVTNIGPTELNSGELTKAKVNPKTVNITGRQKIDLNFLATIEKQEYRKISGKILSS